MTNVVQVLVIGSGFGGAISASRIAEAGFKVQILERGPWRDSVPVRSMGIKERAPYPSGRHYLTKLMRSIRSPLLPGGKATLSKSGFFEMYVGKGLNVLCSSHVGGGSHAYSGINMRPPEPGYWDDIGAELYDEVMDRHYENVMRRMGSSIPNPEHIGYSVRDRFKDSNFIASDESVTAMPMGFQFPKDPDNPTEVVTDDGVTRFEARPGQDGNLGSPGGGKTTLDFAYLARAIKEHGLEVVDMCEALTIRPVLGGEPARYRVSVENLRTGDIEQYYADHVIVAAGTLNTLNLLLRSRAAKGGLKGMPRLGRNFGGNGDFMAYWALKDKDRDLSKSTPATGFVRKKDGSGVGGGRPWPMIVAGAMPSPDNLPLPKFIKRLFTDGAFIAGMGADAQDGTVSLEKGRLTIDYDPDRSQIFQDTANAMDLVTEGTGEKILYMNHPTTVHPMGGACVGNSIEDGVVDTHGEVFDHPGLYVGDAAVLPRPVGGPPSMTIGAWADHLAESFVSRHRGGVGAQGIGQTVTGKAPGSSKP
jgi:cholesterol oxidase